jgi:hypothetical protein
MKMTSITFQVISSEFLHLDEQLAVHMGEEEEAAAAAVVDHEDDDIVSASLAAAGLLVDPDVAPFDDWLVDNDRGLDELAQALTEETDAHLEVCLNGSFSPDSSRLSLSTRS